MNILSYILLILPVVVINLFSTVVLKAQLNEPTAGKIQIKKSDSRDYGGELYLTVNGTEKKIADLAYLAIIINNGKEVVYSAPDGAGGYENEGNSLYIYEVAYNHKRKILSEYFIIDAIHEQKTSDAQTAILVRMSDGGLGASYFAVVDPRRGEVFFRRWAELLKISGDLITLGFYDDWERIVEEREINDNNIFPKPTKVKPYKKEVHNLKNILKNEVIYNEPTLLIISEDRKDLKKVKIYLWRVNDEFQNQNFVLSPVPRYVSPGAPLTPTLSALFGKVTEDEKANGFSSSTFGMKFEGVVLKKGTALVRFSQPAGETNYGSLGPFILLEAIKKTALQFPTVKKVEICAVGETLIDAQLDKPFPRCP